MADIPDEHPIEIDTELQNLLNSLNSDSSPIEADGDVDQPSQHIAPVTAPVTAPVLATAPPSPPPPQQVVQPIENTPASATPALDLSIVVKKFDEVRDKLLANMDNDRARLDTFIELYAHNVQSESPRTPMIEGLTTLLATKVQASANSIRILDSMAKMMAAAKSAFNVESKDKPIQASNLDELLSSDFDPSAP